jgi:hypothetical protein
MTTQLPPDSLSHFSKTPLLEIRSVDQRPQSPDYKSPYDKPRGLWVSVDGPSDWPSWCHSEMPDWMSGVIHHRIRLVESPRILLLANIGMMIDFQSEFGRECGRWDERYIDWPTVAERYHGIIIAPYHWACRYEMKWYYGWDCASGCIWNAEAIASVEQVREAA